MAAIQIYPIIVVLGLFLFQKQYITTAFSSSIVDSRLDVATEKLLNSFEKMLHDTSSAESMSDFTRELTESVMKLLSHVPPTLISNVVEVQTKVAANNEALPNEADELCTRDYTAMCPLNYVDIGNGVHCKALESYTGNCDKLLDMSNKTPLQKRKIARTCGVQWSCRGKCQQDFSFICPHGWTLLDNMLCRAPDNYTGRCVQEKNFKAFDEAMKEQWATECGVKWPCKKQNFDFSSKLCPLDWTETEDKKCVAPKYYIGPCDMFIPIETMQNDEKYKLSYLCNLQWPSKSTINHDFSSPCPLGWLQVPKEYAYCKAPESYEGPCESIQTFENFSDNEKYKWAIKCGVTWPFKENIKRNYGALAFCPIGWTLIDKESGMCEANANYDGPCSSPFSFKNYSPIMKASWAHVCKASFEPIALINKNKIQDNLKPLRESINGFESTKKGVIGLPGSPFWGKILEPNGTVYLSSEGEKHAQYFPIKPNRKASELIAMQHHIDLLEKIKQYEKKPQVISAIENAIAQIKARGQNENIEFSFMQIKNRDNKDYDFEEKYDFLLPYVNQIQESYSVAADPVNGGVIENPEYGCVRNYNGCPKEWQNLDNIRCMAPDVYLSNGGTCKSVVELGRMVDKQGFRDIDQIKNWSKKCRVEFPCLEFQHDYVRVLCPTGWRHLGNGKCIAPENYPNYLKERCGTIVNFKYATPEFRQTWAKICGADWPVFAHCEPDYSDPCPLGFTKFSKPTEFSSKMNKCKAYGWNSDSQEEFCRSPLIIPDDPVAKHEISIKCGVFWRCINQCKMDFWQKCPYGWTYKFNKCYAPSDYLPPPGCSSVFSVSRSIFSINKYTLYKIASQCHAPWPCEGSCQNDWRYSCPHHWKEDHSKRLQGQVICYPPKNYYGPCGTKEQNLTSYTFAQKQEFAFRCEVKWPCGGTKTLLNITLKTDKGWQIEDSYKDIIWESLNTAETMFDPPLARSEQKIF